MGRNGVDSVTRWIKDLGTSRHDEAARLLWDRYFARIAGRAQGWLRDVNPGAVDGEDVALSVLDDFFRGASEGRFDRLDGREDLWRLLMTIAVRKARNKARAERRSRRCGGGRGADVETSAQLDDRASLSEVADPGPTPEVAAMVADEVRKLFEVLANDSLRTVVRLKLDGHSNGEVASELDCGLRTVERKLEVIRKRWLAEGS